MKFSGLSILSFMLMAVPLHAGVPAMPRPQQLSVIDGLPSNIVYDVAQDKEGYLWFATGDGLARYDSHGFRIWRREDGLRDNVVDCVYVDAQDRVWIGTDSGGVAMLGRDRRNFVYTDVIGHERIDTSQVWDVIQTGDGDLWIGTAGAGLLRVHDDRAQRFLPKDGDPRSLPGEVITDLALDAHGALWVATNQGAARWDGSGFARVAQDATASPYITGLVPDHGGGMWLRSVHGGGFADASNSHAQDWKLPPQMMVYGPMVQDAEGGYWLFSNLGLIHKDEDGQQRAVMFSGLTHDIANPQFERALVDRMGGLWFATRDEGVWHLPSDWRRFAVLTPNVPTGKALGNVQVFGAADSHSGNMWLVGTTGTLDELDPESGRVYPRHVSKPEQVLNSVLETGDGKVWMGGDGMLARFDPSTSKMQIWTQGAGRDASLGGDAESMLEDSHQLLWVWHKDCGFEIRDRTGKRVGGVPLDDGQGLPLGLALEQMRLGPSGDPWLASSAGLLAWDRHSQRFSPVAGIAPGEVDGFDFAEDGTLWLARMGVVEAYMRAGDGMRLLRRVGAEAGIPQVSFNGLTVDRRGVLWLASPRGLARFDPQQPGFRMYGITDGFPGQEIQEAPLSRKGDGRLLVIASHGVVVFDPVALRPSRMEPHLTIDTVVVGHGSEAQRLPPDAPFRLGYDNRDLRVVARLLSYDNVRGHRYRFRLRGFDDDWVEAGNDGERTFSRLPPGQYVLQVQGFNADNVASSVHELRFEVTPPWWQTWWAICLYALALLLLLLWAALAYRRRLRRRHAWKLAEEKQRLAEQASLAKTQFLATLGHEVRTPMTGVLGMSELLLGTSLDDRQRGYAGAIRRAGTHLLRLVNDALDLARIEAGKLELQAEDFDLHELVAGVTELIAPLAAQRGLDFAAIMEPGAPAALRGDPMRVRQILLNLLGNAVKFTERGRIGLRVQALEGGGVRLLVSDTGPGLNAEQQARLFQRFEQAEGARTAARYGGSGLGLAICQELAAEMDGRIGVDSAPGQGTRFVVELPLPNVPAVIAAVPAASPAAARALDVLLIEDDATVAEVMSGLLQARGHRVVHVAHGLQALAEAATARFDIALLDLDLPGMDGLQLARQLRGLGFSAPLLAVTARADAEAEPQAMAAGFDGFIRKPLTGNMLLNAMKSLLGPQWQEVD